MGLRECMHSKKLHVLLLIISKMVSVCGDHDNVYYSNQYSNELVLL